MEEKAKWNFNPPCILGITLSFIGIIYLLVGLGLWGNAADMEAVTVGNTFTPLGAVFGVVGVGCLAFCLHQKKTADRLLEEGHYVWGKITQIKIKRNVNTFGGHPSVAVVHYQDGSGKKHIFHSRYIYRGLDPSAAGKSVRVYIDDETCKRYYVDMEPVLHRDSKQ